MNNETNYLYNLLEKNKSRLDHKNNQQRLEENEAKWCDLPEVQRWLADTAAFYETDADVKVRKILGRKWRKNLLKIMSVVDKYKFITNKKNTPIILSSSSEFFQNLHRVYTDKKFTKENAQVTSSN